MALCRRFSGLPLFPQCPWHLYSGSCPLANFQLWFSASCSVRYRNSLPLPVCLSIFTPVHSFALPCFPFGVMLTPFGSSVMQLFIHLVIHSSHGHSVITNWYTVTLSEFPDYAGLDSWPAWPVLTVDIHHTTSAEGLCLLLNELIIFKGQ